MSSLLINGSAPTALQLAAIRADLGLGSGTPGAANGVALLDSNADLPAVQMPNNVGPLGPYTTLALLEAAWPSASNPGKTAYIGATAPYTEYVSNGVTGVTGWKALVTAYTDPLTGKIAGIVDSKDSSIFLLNADSRRGVPTVLRTPQKVMASPPPTVSTSTAATQITSARQISIGGNGDSSFPYNSSTFYPLFYSLVTPAAGAQAIGPVTTNAAGTAFQNQSFRYLIDFDGTEIEFQNQSAGGRYWIKINDEYIDPVGVTLPSDAAIRYIKVLFAARTQCRIEFVSFNLALINVSVDATAGVSPAPIRGPRMIMVGDSFNGAPDSYPRVIADMYGWDDVWNSGMGGTGFIANNSGTLQTFVQRTDHDVITYAPNIAWYVGSVNDDGYAPDTVAAAVLSVRNKIVAALPDCWFIWSPNASNGPASWSANKNKIRLAIKAALSGLKNTYVVDPLELPSTTPTSVPTSTLESAVSVGATSLYVFGTWDNGGYPAPGSIIAMDDERIEVKSGAFAGTSGGKWRFLVQIDGTVQQAHAAGAVWTVVGGSYITGSGSAGNPTGYGSSDAYRISAGNIHPTFTGQLGFGKALAVGFSRALPQI